VKDDLALGGFMMQALIIGDHGVQAASERATALSYC
jgi:hypothetical protein